MADLLRVQVLVETRQREALTRLAQAEGRSVSALIRDMIDQGLERRERSGNRQREALARLTQIREENEREYGFYNGDLIAETRVDREIEMEQLWRGES